MGLPDKYFDAQANVSPTNSEAKPDLAAVLNGVYESPWQSGVVVTADVVTLSNPGPVIAAVATAGSSTGSKSLVNAAPGTGDVQVAYDAEGVPTLTFNATDAVTTADIHQLALPTIPS